MRARASMAIAAAVLIAGTGTSPFAAGIAAAGRDDPPGNRDANHCIRSGVDGNELYGISEQFRNRDCVDLTAGEHWVLGPLLWWVDDGVDSVYPPGYVPAAPAPLDDFVSKLVAVRMVIDGTTYTFAPSDVLRTDININQLDPTVDPAPTASILPRVRPLSVGDHTFQPFLVLSAEHCDGIAPVEDENCLPAGEFAYGPERIVTVSVPQP
jgi:hypothetical protein